MNGAGEIKSFHILSWLSLGNAAESDKRDLMAELDTMKQLKPHPHVIKLLGCVTESGELIHGPFYMQFIKIDFLFFTFLICIPTVLQ